MSFSFMGVAVQEPVREYLQPLVARVKVPRCRCHGAG